MDTNNNGLSIQKQNRVFGTVNRLLVATENAAILFLGAKLVMANQFSVGMLIAFISYKGKFISRISALMTWPHLAFGCSAGSTPVRSATNSSTARATCAENMNTSAE